MTQYPKSWVSRRQRLYLTFFFFFSIKLKHFNTGSSAAPRIRSTADLLSAVSPKAEVDSDRVLLFLALLTLALLAAVLATAEYLIESVRPHCTAVAKTTTPKKDTQE